MASSLSNLVNNLSEGTLHKKTSFPLKISSVNVTKSVVSCSFSGIHKIKCKHEHQDEKCETYINIAIVFLNTQALKMI